MAITNREMLVKVIKNTKTALVEEWQEKQAFVDKNKFAKEGILPECVGLTSLMLMTVAFGEDRQILSAEEITGEIKQIAEGSILKIKQWVESDGYSAKPVLDSGIFDKEIGYLDTVTWVLSSAILTRYAEKTLKMEFSQNVVDATLALICDSLDQLLRAQKEDGTWGFSTQADSTKSLYFTYVANTSLADFYDYVMGEIKEVEEINTDVEGENFCDSILLGYINNVLNCDIKARVDAAREKVQMFLIRDCLPLLPKLSGCRQMEEAERRRLGMWDDSSFDTEEQTNYYNLYYAYYLLDMLVSSASDLRFNQILEDADERKQLKAYYEKHKLVNGMDLHYFFDEEKCAHTAELLKDSELSGEVETFWTAYMEQAIHTTRGQFMSATRTGDYFWDLPDSELPVRWLHDNTDLAVKHKGIIKRKVSSDGIPITEPAVVSMSLRTNAQYCYYISQKADIAVERLFHVIHANAATETNDDCRQDLWDDQSYNLLVTERSIEALVDFYDYLNKFEKVEEQTRVGANATERIEKSAFEISFEEKIKEYLRSEEGKQLIAAAVTGGTSGADQIDVAALLETVQQGNYTTPSRAEGDSAKLLADLVSLHDALTVRSLLAVLDNNEAVENKRSGANRAAAIVENANRMMLQYRKLLESVYVNLENRSAPEALAALYKHMIDK